MKVALVHASGFKRLPAHFGADLAYLEAEQAGQVPHPYFITGASAGAVASAFSLPWTKENLKRRISDIINLKTSDIYSMRRLTELCGALTLGESFLNFIPPLQHDFMKSRRGQILIEAGRTGISLASKIGFFFEFLKQPSIFSNEPFRRLLKSRKRGLDFEAIWGSDVKLEIPAVDLKTAQMVYFTNYLSEHRQLPNRNDVLVNMVRASSSVTASLPAIPMGQCLLDDAANLNGLPLDRAIQHGCDVVFAIIHQPYLEKIDLKKPEMTWVEELNRAMDIAIGRNVEMSLERCQEINNDLEIIQDLEAMIDEIPQSSELLQRPHLMKFLLKKFSAYGKTKTRIIPVFSEEPLSNSTFDKFNEETLRKGVGIGYRAMKKALENIK